MGDTARGALDPALALRLVGELDELLATRDFGTVVRRTLELCARRLGVSRTSITLLRGEPPVFHLFDTSQPIDGLDAGRVLPLDAGVMGEVVRTRQASYRPDLGAVEPRYEVDRRLLAGGVRSTLSVPLLCGGRCLGTFNLGSDAIDGIPEATREAVALLTPRVAQALELTLHLAALTASERRFRVFFEEAVDGFLVGDPETGRCITANAALCHLLGVPPEQIPSLRLADVWDVEPQPPVSGAPAMGHPVLTSNARLRRADGAEVYVDVRTSLSEIDGHARLLCLFRDVTERRRLEARLLEAEKLRSLRTLAAGIAHDFNNLLTGILGSVSLAQMDLPAGTPTQELLGDAIAACREATGLTHQLLAFTTGGKPVRSIVDLATIVPPAVSLAARGRNVRACVEVSGGSWPVNADAAQLTQVVQNLVLNAIQAMPAGGRVDVRIRRLDAWADAVPTSDGTARPAAYGIEVDDSGPGIPADAQDRLFDPFFSTRAEGHGLGLAVVRSIVHDHGGAVTAENRPEGGARFTVILPAAAAPPRPPEPEATPGRGGHGRILVMDDEAAVRKLVERVLGKAGYATTSANEGQAAVEAYREALASGHPYDLVLLDLTVVDGLGGREAATQILALDPSACLVVSSGYSAEPVVAEYRAHGFTAALPKPYSAAELRDLVATLLGPHAS